MHHSCKLRRGHGIKKIVPRTFGELKRLTVHNGGQLHQVVAEASLLSKSSAIHHNLNWRHWILLLLREKFSPPVKDILKMTKQKYFRL